MSWANCGTDSTGRPIGYAHAATCDHPECDAVIDRGLAYVCGDMHGEDELNCELYFCDRHRSEAVVQGERMVTVCVACAKALLASGWVEDEGVLREKDAA